LQDYAKPLKPEPVEIDDLRKEIEGLLSTVKVPSNIEIKLDFDKSIPVLRLDATFLKRIIINLATNSIQAMPDGGKLTVRAYQKDAKLVITVEDTGIGIPEELKPKMFTPLLTTKAKGQGFGLAVVKRYTEALGGTISFESQVGKGTKFIINLPSIES
jgi:signal transduction histidine kinase